MKPSCTFTFAAASLLSASACFAAPTWDGTWKLNTAKSKFTGDTFTISSKGSGMMHYSTGSTVAYDFACDGKAYPVLADRTVTCTGSPQSGFDYTSKGGATVLSTSHHALSADGKTLTITGKSNNPDGSTSDYSDIYQRQTPGTGLEGKWLDVKVSTTSDTMILKLTGNTLHIEYPIGKVSIDAKLDGTPTPVTGPTIPAGAMETYKSEGPNKLHYVGKYKEKTLQEGTESLSADGKTITEENWEPGKMNEKATLVWEKQ